MAKVSIKNLSKSFPFENLNEKSALSLLKSAIRISRKKPKMIHSLKNVSLELRSGEVMGLIGRNGSGKTTLLRILAGIYSPDKGIVSIKGPKLYLSGHTINVIPRLSVLENITYTGIILNIPAKIIKSKRQVILEFSGLTHYKNLKAYKLSSGMIMRLTFAMSIYFIQDIENGLLLLDEFNSGGGDIIHSKKQMNKLAEFTQKGSTVLMASHNAHLLRGLCQKVVWIEQGEIWAIGNAHDIIPKYEEYCRTLN